MSNILALANQYGPELLELRKAFHRWPEIGNQEFKTSERIENYLNSLGIETQRILGTAIIGTLKGGKPGKTVALRADMDCLPITEQTGVDFASEHTGFMHACGHDVHMTAALGAAKILSTMKDELCGTVKFFFQPDEEGRGGALRMIAEGCLEGVSAVFGAHVSPELPEGTVGVNYGKFYAASDIFEITVNGKSAHGATPEKGIDALHAASMMVCRFKEIPSMFPDDKCVVTTGKMVAGTAENVLAGKAVMNGTIRTLGPEMRKNVKELVAEAVADVDAKIGTTTDLHFMPSYPGIVNHRESSEMVYEVAKQLLGPENAIEILQPTMTSEDFGYFIENVSGCFYQIGAGCSLPLHSAGFIPTDKAVITGAAIHSAVLMKALNG